MPKYNVAYLLLAAACALAATAPAAHPADVALTGRVTSAQEGAMEGVLVSAHRDGSPVTVTVVSDKDGRYAFPADRLAPGRYALAIRAVGYELDGSATAEVAPERAANVDL